MMMIFIDLDHTEIQGVRLYMTHARKNIRASYVMACTMALASPLANSTIPAVLAVIMVAVTSAFFGRAHGWQLGCTALFSLALAIFGILLTIHPAILSTYFG